MSYLLTNWRTSLAGVAGITYCGLALMGIDVPLAPHLEPGAAVTGLIAGVTGLLAKDGNK